MSAVLFDEFRGDLATALDDHTPDFGGPWVLTAAQAAQLDGAADGNATEWLYSGGLWLPNSGVSVIPTAAPAAPLADADCAISAVITWPAGATPNSEIAGVITRWNGTTTWVELVYDSDADLVTLNEVVAGVVTQTVSWAGEGFETQIPIHLSLAGDQATVQIRNTEQPPETLATVLAAGRAGVRIATNGATTLPNSLRIGQLLVTLL